MTVYYSAMALLLAAVAVFPAAAQEFGGPNTAAPPATAGFGIGQPLGDFTRSPSLGGGPVGQDVTPPKASPGVSGEVNAAPTGQGNFGGESTAPDSDNSVKPFFDETSLSHSGGGGQMKMLDMSAFLPTPQDVEESKPPPAPAGNASSGPEVSPNVQPPESEMTRSQSLGAQEAAARPTSKPTNNRPRGNRNSWAPSTGGCGGGAPQVNTSTPGFGC